MGRICQEILQEFARSRSHDIIDFGADRAARKRSEEYQSHLNDMALLLRRGFDPLHASYISAHNLVSLLCEELSMLSLLKPFVRLVSAAETTYMPDGPPFSALTRSYFTSWAFFDVAFGKDRETIGGCIQALGDDLEIDAGLLYVIQLMQQSYMGIYEHCGRKDPAIILRDIVTDKRYPCYVPTGYPGKEGQLWYVRLLPPLSGYHYNVAFTTPYILLTAKDEWISFLNRTVPQLKAPFGPRLVSDAIHDLLKYGLNVNYWHEFIHLSYVGAQDNAIFLSGIPDRAESLPKSKEFLVSL